MSDALFETDEASTSPGSTTRVVPHHQEETNMLDQPCTPTWRHTYNGIPVIELGEDGEWIIAPGHIDPAAFAAACEAYYQDVCGEPLPDTDPVSSIDHTTARIIPAAEFPYGEYEVRFNDGDVDITVWTQP